jgi:ABC-2 type transport system permease protein
MRSLFGREMKANRKSLIIWSIGIILFMVSGMAKYQSYAASAQSLNEMLAKMPEALRAILGMGTFDLTTLTGYFGLLFFYLVLMATIHAAMLGANIIAKEERDKTTEFLFLRPISRNRIITAKLLAALINIVVFNLVTAVSSLLLVAYYRQGETVFRDIVRLMAGMLVLQLIFLFVGTAIAAISKYPRSAPSLAAAVLLFTFILSVAIDLSSKLQSLKYLTPFKYFDAKKLIYGPGFEPVFEILAAVLIAGLVFLTYFCYQNRDLRI